MKFPAASVIKHGVFIEVFGLGVLIAGSSGVGKSELALELLARGHRLIADDAAEFSINPQGELIGCCAPLLRGFLEVRGLGILNIQRMFGDAAIADARRLDLVLYLQPGLDRDEELNRINGRRAVSRMLEIEVAEITLPIRVGHNLAALTEAACRDQKLRIAGYSGAEDFVDRQSRAIRNTEIE